MAGDHKRSVAKIHVTRRKPDAYQPWDMQYQRSASGSACVVEGRRLLTCAHVVEHALHIEATRPGDAKRYAARAELVDHDRELALLVVDDPAFFEGMVAVELGGLPAPRAVVSVWGYPGGQLTTTTGIITRVDVTPYTHSQRRLLALQTDAVVNGGNSGGPVFADGKLVALALQGPDQAEDNTSHLIPAPIIEQFFVDAADGQIGGVPELGARWQKIENPALAAFLGLSPARTGVLVTQVVAGSSADGVIRPGDVLAAIDGVSIACDGTFPMEQDERIEHSVLVSRRQIGERVRVDLIREGQSVPVECVLRPRVSALRFQPGEAASYFIGGGLVFQRLTYELMKRWDWADIDDRFKVHYVHGIATSERAELVFVSYVLADELNAGYHDTSLAIVARVNGRPIGKLADVVEAWGRPLGAFHVVELESAARRRCDSPTCLRVVLDAERARDALPEILARHAIAHDRSPDLRSQ